MSKVARIEAVIGMLMLADKVWRHLLVARFFSRDVPEEKHAPGLVSIIQPILSGDPTMPACLECNLQMQTRYPLEYIWLVDTDDAEGIRICQELMARYPGRNVRQVTLPPPGEGLNPKMVKLIEGARLAVGDVICVLDDDTQLPNWGLEKCLPYLDVPGVGLAFGLPYYVNFSNLWSSLVSYFVDTYSLPTYIPYTSLSDPFTINGMFYAIRREKLAEVGGFEGLEGTLADDFAVAQRFRGHGYKLAQTPILHGISTQVRGARHYLNLIQRWFIFPRESLMRHLSAREKGVLYGSGLVPVLFPLLLTASLLLKPGRRKAAYALFYFGYTFGMFAHINRAYLGGAAPWKGAFWVPLIQVLFPLQLLAALLSPQRINWRGHVIKVEKGGSFRSVQRRNKG